jgi:hypothetical protein
MLPVIRVVSAERYVTALREGGSMPAIVEGDDEGLYVLKFRGAGQGPKALIAELVAGEIARCAGLRVPEIVFMPVHPELARTEPDAEIQSLLRASGGLNLGLDYLPGSIGFDPVLSRPDAALASAIVWFDAFVCNVDRTARNTNMLIWHGNLWLIDHGAALYFHHAWTSNDDPAANPFKLVKDHVLLPAAADLVAVDARMRALLTPEKMAAIVALIPDEWLADDAGFADKPAQRAAYRRFFASRLENSAVFVEEALRARSAYL